MTGGVLGVMILAFIPAILAFYARKHNLEKKLGHSNPLKSWFQNQIWLYGALVLSPILIGFNLYFYIYSKVGGN